MTNPKKFPPAVIEKLGYYVYFLIHPKTNKILYVGRGIGNRVFMHIKEAMDSPNSNDKLEAIRAITKKNLNVKHLIHRHGLTEKEAIEVESALIDFIGLENLLNHVLGYEADERGQKTVNEIITQYNASEINIAEPSILLIVNKNFYRGISEKELYEITRKYWNVAPKKHQAKYAFAVCNGIVRQVYEIEKWYRSPSSPGKYIFKGKTAKNMQHYINGNVTKYLAFSVLKYVNC